MSRFAPGALPRDERRQMTANRRNAACHGAVASS
jgi:hypothetical protein